MRRGDAVWTRRSFLQAASCAAVAAATPGAPAYAHPLSSIFAFASVAIDSGTATKLQSYRVSNGRWQQTDEVTLPTPVHISAHPTLPVLYARHDVALWDHLPRGAVSAYRVNVFDGTLTRVVTQPLSLAATHPVFAAVAANGTSLLVGTRAGIYNLLPLDLDGNILPVAAIRKEYGRTVPGADRPSAPAHAIPHPDGTFLAADVGQGTLSRFRHVADQLLLEHRQSLHARSGAQQVAVSNCGRWAYALHADDASIAVHRMTPKGMCAAHQTVAGRQGRASLLLSSCGRFLLRADSSVLSVFQLDAHTGELSGPMETLPLQLRHLSLTPDGTQLIGMNLSTGDVVTIALQHNSPVLGSRRTVMRAMSRCTSLVFCSA